MYSKISNILFRPKIKIPGIDSNRRLTKIFRESLNSSWVHPYVRVRRFVRDYSLPVTMTAVFLLLIIVASLVRVFQQTSLANLLAGVTTIGQDYGTLFSKDKTDELKKNSDNSLPTAPAPAGTPTSFAINTNTGGNSSSGNTPPTSGGDTPLPLVFGASIAYFQQDSVTLDCTTPKPKRQTCSKRYNFGGGIRTQNGPGSVNYGWRSSTQSAVEDGSISVGGGEILTPMQKSITLACLPASSFSLQLTLSSPTPTQSATINVDHNCNEF